MHAPGPPAVAVPRPLDREPILFRPAGVRGGPAGRGDASTNAKRRDHISAAAARQVLGWTLEPEEVVVYGRSLIIRTAALALALLAPLAAADRADAQQRRVTINQVRISDAQLGQLERQYRVRIVDGDYWYDRRVGAWGYWRGPAMGLAVPGLAVGGTLPANASGGGTGVFFNGRELHPADVAALRAISPVVLPGRYWLDADGWGGYEGQGPFFNLWAMAAQAQSAAGGNRSWIHRGPGGGMGGDGNCVYYIGGNSSASVGC